MLSGVQACRERDLGQSAVTKPQVRANERAGNSRALVSYCLRSCAASCVIFKWLSTTGMRGAFLITGDGVMLPARIADLLATAGPKT